MKFLVVGDAMLDIYLIGEVSRLNPEGAHIPLVNVHKTMTLPGGASNVRANLESMGATAVLMCQNSGFIKKNRIVVDDRVISRFDEEDPLLPIHSDDLKNTLQTGFDAVLVSDYGKGAITGAVVHVLSHSGLPTFVDTKVRPHLWTPWCAGLFPNEREYRKNKSDYDDAALCVVKRAQEGLTILTEGRTQITIKPSVVGSVLNVAGAGDTLFAAFVAAYSAMGFKGYSHLLAAAQIATDFASDAVTQAYTSTPSFDSVYNKEPEIVKRHASGDLRKMIAEKIKCER